MQHPNSNHVFFIHTGRRPRAGSAPLESGDAAAAAGEAGGAPRGAAWVGGESSTSIAPQGSAYEYPSFLPGHKFRGADVWRPIGCSGGAYFTRNWRGLLLKNFILKLNFQFQGCSLQEPHPTLSPLSQRAQSAQSPM